MRHDDGIEEAALAMMQVKGGPGTPDHHLAKVAIDAYLRVASSKITCVHCRLPIYGKMIGAGDGTGQKFACPECYWRERARRLREALESASGFCVLAEAGSVSYYEVVRRIEELLARTLKESE